MLIVLTLVMGLSLEAALLSLALDIGQKSEQELKAFGSNILLLPKDDQPDPGSGAETLQGNQGYIPEAQLTALDGSPLWLEGYAPFLYSLATVNGTQAVISGTVFDQALKINPWWKITGEIPASGGNVAVVGSELASSLNLRPGDLITINGEGEGGKENLMVTGILSSGGSEDNQVIMDLEQAQSMSGLADKVSVIQISVPASDNLSLDQFSTSLEERIPGARAKTVRQVAEASQNLLSKIKLLMGLVTLLIVFISGLTVSASLANAVIERRREIGLMKSLGAEGRGIAVIILGESLSLGFLAGPAGCLLGLVLAQAVGLSVFETTVSFHLPVIPVVMASAALLAFVASLMPVRRALSIEPAVILRGE